MKNRKFWSILLILLPLIAAALYVLPDSVRMKWASPDEPLYTYISGYDMLAVGYALYDPILTGVSSVIASVLGIVCAVKPNEKSRKQMRGFVLFAMACCVCTAIRGAMTWVGAVIFFLLIVEFVLLMGIRKYETTENEE